MRRSTEPTPVTPAPSVEAEIGELMVRLLSSAKDHFMRGLAEMDLTSAQGFALHHLEAPLSMRQLADEMGYDASHITGIVDKLEALGLVERRPDPRDRRIKLLVTTAKGRALRRRIQDQVFDRQPILDRLDAAERRRLLALLQRAVGDPGPVPAPTPARAGRARSAAN
jgi:MarR family transcriptional regulator, organic hydroperoxide resistance regulator